MNSMWGLKKKRFINFKETSVQYFLFFLWLLQWAEFMELGRDEPDAPLDEIIASQKSNQCCTLIYTSGTTGHPKGVMLSHDNVSFSPVVSHVCCLGLTVCDGRKVQCSWHLRHRFNMLCLQCRFSCPCRSPKIPQGIKITQHLAMCLWLKCFFKCIELSEWIYYNLFWNTFYSSQSSRIKVQNHFLVLCSSMQSYASEWFSVSCKNMYTVDVTPHS